MCGYISDVECLKGKKLLLANYISDNRSSEFENDTLTFKDERLATPNSISEDKSKLRVRNLLDHFLKPTVEGISETI